MATPPGRRWSPGLSVKATASKARTIWPRRNHPRSPPCTADPESIENRWAATAKSPPARRAMAIESASARAAALEAAEGWGAITSCRNATAAGLCPLSVARVEIGPELVLGGDHRLQRPLVLGVLEILALQDASALLVGEPAPVFLRRPEAGVQQLLPEVDLAGEAPPHLAIPVLDPRRPRRCRSRRSWCLARPAGPRPPGRSGRLNTWAR